MNFFLSVFIELYYRTLHRGQKIGKKLKQIGQNPQIKKVKILVRLPI